MTFNVEILALFQIVIQLGTLAGLWSVARKLGMYEEFLNQLRLDIPRIFQVITEHEQRDNAHHLEMTQKVARLMGQHDP